MQTGLFQNTLKDIIKLYRSKNIKNKRAFLDKVKTEIADELKDSNHDVKSVAT